MTDTKDTTIVVLFQPCWFVQNDSTHTYTHYTDLSNT